MRVISGSYTGNGTSQTINVGFQPDVVFIKNNAAADTDSKSQQRLRQKP